MRRTVVSHKHTFTPHDTAWTKGQVERPSCRLVLANSQVVISPKGSPTKGSIRQEIEQSHAGVYSRRFTGRSLKVITFWEEPPESERCQLGLRGGLESFLLATTGMFAELNMTHLLRKSPGIVVALGVAIGGACLFLIAKPLFPAPLTPLAEALAEPAAPPTAKSTSTRPKITWSTTSTQVILARGQTASEDFAFTSNVNLQDVVIEPVPEISPFLTVQPTSFASVPAGQSRLVHILYSIPASTTLGTYVGTIHVRVGGSTLPQTLKVTINAWTMLTDVEAGFSAFYPPSLYNIADPNNPPGSIDLESSAEGVAIGGAVVVGSHVAASGFAVGIDATPYNIAGTFDVTQYLAAEYPNSASDASITTVTIGGQPGYEIFFRGEETGNWPVAVVFYRGYIYRFLYSSTDNIAGFSDQDGLKAFSEVLEGFTFSP